MKNPMTKKEMLATLRTFAAPLPDRAIQVTRHYTALNLIGAYLDVLEPYVQDKPTLTQLSKIRRWHAECVNTRPQIPKHAASWRYTEKQYMETNALIHDTVVARGMKDANIMAAWGHCIYGVFLDAICTAKDVAKGKAWIYLEKTFTTLISSFEKQYPEGHQVGWDIYRELEV